MVGLPVALVKVLTAPGMPEPVARDAVMGAVVGARVVTITVTLPDRETVVVITLEAAAEAVVQSKLSRFQDILSRE